MTEQEIEQKIEADSDRILAEIGAPQPDELMDYQNCAIASAIGRHVARCTFELNPAAGAIGTGMAAAIFARQIQHYAILELQRLAAERPEQ